MSDEKQADKPRLTVDITREMQARLQKQIPWGLQASIFRTMIEGLLDLMEGNPTQRDAVIACFLSRDITVLDLLRRVSPNEPK